MPHQTERTSRSNDMLFRTAILPGAKSDQRRVLFRADFHLSRDDYHQLDQAATATVGALNARELEDQQVTRHTMICLDVAPGFDEDELAAVADRFLRTARRLVCENPAPVVEFSSGLLL